MSIESLLMLAVSPSEGGNTFVSLTKQFGVNWKLLVAQIINFCLVAFVLYRYAFKPILKTLDVRQKKIADGLQFAEEMEHKLRESEKQYADTVKQGAEEAKQIVERARAQAKTYFEQQAHEATLKAEDIITKAEESIEMEKQQMLLDVRKDIADLVITTTGKVLAKQLTPDEQSSYSKSVAKELSLN